ncbi:MAG: hypothetical protein KME29_30310 [Calothrix sp. FI2-JRJ7]|jgi:transposase|nr:hypothetical protein [Calothrix sp. FI2-JRJ7]
MSKVILQSERLPKRFDVSKSFVQKLLEMKKTEGHVEPRKQGGGMKSELDFHRIELVEMVEKYSDATLSEYCEYWGQKYNMWVSTSASVSRVTKTKFNSKKKTLRSSQGATERVQNLRLEFWEQVKAIDPENLVFLDEMGVLVGLTRTHARSRSVS